MPWSRQRGLTSKPMTVDPDAGGTWNVDSLRVYLLALLEQATLRNEQRFNAQEVAVLRAIAATERALQAALAEAEKAVLKEQRTNDQRFTTVNEFRGQLADQAATFLTRSEYEAKHEGLQQRILAVEKAMDQRTGKEQGVQMSAGMLVGAATLVSLVIGIVVVLANVLTG